MDLYDEALSILPVRKTAPESLYPLMCKSFVHYVLDERNKITVMKKKIRAITKA